MKRELLYGMSGLVVGAAVSGAVVWAMVGGLNGSSNHNTLAEKTGDEFDKAFIEQMIPHHEGAIEMAKQAKEQARHGELKQLSEEIVMSQSQEIEKLKQWQVEWGYGADRKTKSNHHY